MRRPPDAHYSFTIPSIHDDTTLDCRVYHPDILIEPKDSADIIQWRRKGIVMAHPYAPMGGSYDDRVVGIVVEEFLHAGWIVGTFNFRGAHGSKGRTSWSGRPELDDYTSFAAFFIHYMSYLRPRITSDLNFAPDQLAIPTNQSELAPTHDDEPPIVILGGYSYGSLILRHLPPIPTILQPFSAPVTGTAADEIVLRARRLADQSNLGWINLARDETRARRKSRAGNESRPPVAMGGEETSPEKRRSSRDVRRSLEGGTGIRTRLRSLSHSHKRRESHEPTPRPEAKSAITTMPDVRYLLISPLTPPISTLAAPALIHRFWSRSKDDHQDVVGKHTSLAIFGDQDAFTSAKRIRDWSEQLKAEPASRFTSVEIVGAGHFWIEKDVEVRLRTAMKNWESTIR